MLLQGRLPDLPIYEAFQVKRLDGWLRLAAIAAGALLLSGAGALVLYRKANRAIASQLRLSVVMAGLFVCLSIPILIFILTFNHQKNSEVIVSMLQEQIGKLPPRYHRKYREPDA